MDDYTLAILPLARLLGDNAAAERCSGPGRNGQVYCEVVEAGVLGYGLFTYYGLLRVQFGEDVERKVRERHIRIFAHVKDLDLMLAMIDAAIRVGTVTTPTAQGEIVTPVEMNVALALLLGHPASPHYVVGPGQRQIQIARMAPEIDWCFADCLAHARRDMIGVLTGMMRINLYR